MGAMPSADIKIVGSNMVTSMQQLATIFQPVLKTVNKNVEKPAFPCTKKSNLFDNNQPHWVTWWLDYGSSRLGLSPRTRDIIGSLWVRWVDTAKIIYMICSVLVSPLAVGTLWGGNGIGRDALQNTDMHVICQLDNLSIWRRSPRRVRDTVIYVFFYLLVCFFFRFRG